MKYFSINLSNFDIYINVVGGLKISSRDIDLAILTSILSSLKGLPVSTRSVIVGEVGLTGEVRRMKAMGQVCSEVEKMKYAKIINEAEGILKELKQ